MVGRRIWCAFVFPEMQDNSSVQNGTDRATFYVDTFSSPQRFCGPLCIITTN